MQDELLQRYFDGELAPEEHSHVEALVQSTPALQAELEAWQHIRTGLRAMAGDVAPAVDAEALFARIDAELQAESPAVTAAARSAPKATQQPPKTRPSRAPVGRPALTVVQGGGMPVRRQHWVGAIATLVAAAAAVMLFIRRQPAALPGASATGGVTATVPRGSEVMEADFGGSTGTVFAVEGEAGQPIAVVWIDDNQGMP
ncbi:MAG: anti-sigma factor family protein [Polyangiales bacterium]